jgi:gluconate 2-dehydrogenase gamma chain
MKTIKTITRRVFISSSVLAGTALALMPQGCTQPNIKINLFKTLEGVQEVLFPKGLDAPSAIEFGATAYLANFSSHSSFLASDSRFLKHGAQELMNDHNNFLSLSPKERDHALREFVDDNDTGQNWVSFVLYFTIEALLSSPVYGGNKNESGWKWLQHNAGVPQPKVPFAQNLKGEVV